MAVPAVAGATKGTFWSGAGGTAVAQGASGILGGAMGMTTRNWYDKKQLKQQERLQKLGIRGAKELADYDQKLAYDMWQKTNFDAERKQMEKAGLNVGLMYGGGMGAGGTTQGAGKANYVPSGNAPAGGGEIGMGLQIGLDNMMKLAQIELTKKQAEKIGTEIPNIGKEGEKLDAEIKNLIATTENITLKNAYQEWDNKLKQLEVDTANKTQKDLIDTIASEAKRIKGIAQQELNAGRLSDEGYASQLQSLKNTVIEEGVRIANIKANTELTQAETKKIADEVNVMYQNLLNNKEQLQQGWKGLSNEQERLLQQRLQMQFNTSTPAKIRQWTSIITDILGTLTGAGAGGSNPIGFEYGK